jgi:hypothetical protein
VTQLVKTLNAPFQEVRAASTADGGTALTTTAVYISLPIGTEWVGLIPRNFGGASVVKYAITPWLTIIRTTDDLLTEGINSSDELQDGDSTSVAIDNHPTNSNGGYIYIGAGLPFGGVHIDIGDPNGTASNLTVEYWNGGWVDISDTDNTDTGASLAQDGTVTWTVPARDTVWQLSSLRSNGAVTASAATVNEWDTRADYSQQLYWTRFYWNAAIDASTDLNQVRALSRSTSYQELTDGDSIEFSTNNPVGTAGGIATIEALTNAGTANLIVNAASSDKSARGFA